MSFQKLGLAVPEQRSALESPAVPLGSTVGWHWLEGGRQSDAAEVVNPATGFATGVVNACVALLSQSIATASPLLYRHEGAGKSEAVDNPLHRILSLEPNPECSAFTLWASFVTSICLWGNGYLEVQRDGTGTVQGLWFIRPDQVTPYRQSNGTLAYRCTQGMSAGFRVLPATSVIHVPWQSTDCVLGVSPVQAVRNTIGGNIAMEKHSARFFANYAMPQMALLTKKLVKPEQKQQIKNDWESLHGGSNQHRVAVLDGEMDIKTLTISNEDSQFLESRRFSREEICGLYGLKPSQIGSESRVAGETFAAQQLDFLTSTLGPWLQRIRQELTRKLLAGLPSYSIRHDVSDRLRLDIKSQMDAFSIGRQWGILTANECRRELGMDPGGSECDVFLRAVNMTDANAPNPKQTEEPSNV